jgi:hypothetical protein
MEYGNSCRCEKNGVTYYYDNFYADKLLGTWQCSYNTIIYSTSMNIKEIKFITNRKCDIVYSIGRNVDWYTETYNYSYSSGYIRFSREGNTFSFYIAGYIFPELYLEDSMGKYTWHKVRANGC